MNAAYMLANGAGNQETGAAMPETHFPFLREAKVARPSSPPRPICGQRV